LRKQKRKLTTLLMLDIGTLKRLTTKCHFNSNANKKNVSRCFVINNFACSKKKQSETNR
jgi:hypothetical protein